MKTNERKFKAAFVLIILIYLTAVASFASALLPNVDEAWFTLPAYNLVENGFFGTTVLDETATFRQVRLDGINRHTYWVMPFYSLFRAVWGMIFGFGLINARLASIFFGLTALIAWTVVIKKLSKNSALALLSGAFIAVDYHFIYSSSLARMDMMTVALGISGLAAFLLLREKNFDHAVLVSFTLTASAFFAHPLGLVWFASLVILIALLDYRRITFRHFIFAALPYSVFGLFWLIYILQNPDLFLLQFGGNASDRWAFFRSPLSELWREIRDRYFYNYGIGEGLSRTGQVRIFILMIYVSAVVGVLAVKSLRRQILTKFLLLIVLQEFLMLLLLDSMRQHLYMIYITPTLGAIFAVWINWLWQKGKTARIVFCGLVSLIVLINFSVIFLRVKQDAYHSYYLEATNFLNRSVEPNDKVMGSAELWFALERKENLIDDFRLGFRTGKKAAFIVMDKPRYVDWSAGLAAPEPVAYQFVGNLLQNDYALVYENKNYQIYRRR